jgi:dienelactone hydrolase
VHAALATKAPAKKGTVKSRILVLNGAADPMVPSVQVEAFEKEMKEAGANATVVLYPGAKHAFTNPDAGKAGLPALEYNAGADKQAWAAIVKALKEVFA